MGLLILELNHEKAAYYGEAHVTIHTARARKEQGHATSLAKSSTRMVRDGRDTREASPSPLETRNENFEMPCKGGGKADVIAS